MYDSIWYKNILTGRDYKVLLGMWFSRVYFWVLKAFLKKKLNFFYFKLIFFVFLDYFDADIKNDFSKIKKNYFDTFF